MSRVNDQPMGIAVWWLGLSIVICFGILYVVPHPFGYIAIAAVFGLVGYKIPMRIIANGSAKIVSSQASILN
jgi:hypothetical protein